MDKIILIRKLMKVKDIMEGVEDKEIVTLNRATKEKGIATFLREPGKMKVYEGKDDGSEDKILTYDEFLEKYDYDIRNA